jgi:hypothetical protein
MMSAGADHEAVSSAAGTLRTIWRISVFITICTGILHLFNLVGWGRVEAGPLLLTPFRLSFIISWALLGLTLVSERRPFRPAAFDLILVLFSLAYLARGLFFTETLDIALNWIVTATGVYFLVRLGLRDKRDFRVILFALVASVLVIVAYGLVEYFSKSNPLFESIEVFAIGADDRISASVQYYRIRSLVGHPGFAAAIVLAGVPLVALALWKRRFLAVLSLAASILALFLSFSRGSWLLAIALLIPLSLIVFRQTLRRYLKWVALAMLAPLLLTAFLYWSREEAYVDLRGGSEDAGVRWVEGVVNPTEQTQDGVRFLDTFMYFDVDDDFADGATESATVVVHYSDEGLGILRLDYFTDTADASAEQGYSLSPAINKTDTGVWTNAAFYLEDPKFTVDAPGGSDFRLVDEDNLVTIRRVEVYQGRMDLLSQVFHQWEARAASLSTRLSLYPFAWDVFRDNPWGVGLFNSPGTGFHAVDSLPLTWLMEFGWLSFILLAGVFFMLAYEIFLVLRVPLGVTALPLISIFMLLLHGGHLMILYDKPSIVMLSALLALYVTIRPGRGGRPQIDVALEDCSL